MAGKEYSRVPVEFYIGSRVLSGYLSVVAGRRLLDILNRLGDLDREIQSDYVDFVSDAASPGDEAQQVRYVKKSSVEMAALSDPNLARGAGTKSAAGAYPRVEKVAARVSIELPGYSLDGTMHCSPGADDQGRAGREDSVPASYRCNHGLRQSCIRYETVCGCQERPDHLSSTGETGGDRKLGDAIRKS